MASQLTHVHIETQARLRQIVSSAVLMLWNNLGTYDERDVEPFIAAVLPIVQGGQRQSVALTEGYLARILGRRPIGVSPDKLVGAAVRNGTSPEDVYRRPFVNVWMALKDGKPWEEAVNSGRARVQATAEADVAMSSRATFQAVQDADGGIYGYQRVADGGACSYCVMINGAYVKSADASPLHNRCGCSLEPLTRPHPRSSFLPSGEKTDDYAIHEHGELGSYIGAPDDNFTSLVDVT